MLCEDCGKNEATLHFIIGINGNKQTLSLCGDCARERQKALFGAVGLDMDAIVAGLWNNTKPAQRSPDVVCPRCGCSADDIARSGKLGCAQCYVQFHDAVEPLLRRIHGRTQHVGKVPRRMQAGVSKKRELETLRAQQQVAIQEEQFELAAHLRDSIRILEAQLAQNQAETSEEGNHD